MVGIGLMEAWS